LILEEFKEVLDSLKDQEHEGALQRIQGELSRGGGGGRRRKWTNAQSLPSKKKVVGEEKAEQTQVLAKGVGERTTGQGEKTREERGKVYFGQLRSKTGTSGAGKIERGPFAKGEGPNEKRNSSNNLNQAKE